MPSIESADEDIDESTPRKGDDDLLREIREDYTRFEEWWRPHREESATDRKYLLGDVWDDDDKAQRKEAGRPCINHDELNQFINQAINNVRQNKRGIKITPAGNGATEKTASLRQDLIRTIEYESQAAASYITAFENELQGGYGFCRVGRDYVTNDFTRLDPSIFNQRVTISGIVNPDSVLYDIDCKKPDWSDARKVFVLDPMLKADFKRKYKHAEITDFSSDMIRVAQGWITEKTVMVAEFWKIESAFHMVYLLDSGDVVTKKPKGSKVRLSREIEQKTVVQYITNGVEILERSEHPGELIPIVPFIGKQLWLTEGGQAKLKILSLVRLARDPQMALAYLNSQEMEEAGLSPKTPVRGWVGQFDTDKDAHDTAHKIPHPYLQYDYPEWAMERGIQVGLPEAGQFTPNFQQFEIAKDSARRAIQAAMGITPLPTAAQRDNEKSGVALQHIDSAQTVGSFHFVDNFERGVAFVGRVVEPWISVVYDTERDLALQQPDEKSKIVTINTDQPYVAPGGTDPEHYPVTNEGDHSVTVSSGPSDASTRDAASDFLDTLVSNLDKLPVAPPQKAKLLSLAIQLKQLGPRGDQMAEIISPEQQGNPQAMAIQQQAQAQIAQLQAEIQRLLMEREGKVVENQGKLQIEQFKAGAASDMERFKAEVQVTVAEISTKAQSVIERMEMFMDVAKQLQIHQHERGMQAGDQAHEAAMAQQQQAAAQQQQESQQQAQADQAAQQQPQQVQQ